MTNSIGILAYGSLIQEPGCEIAPAIVRRISCRTPFKVEYARKSNSRNGAQVGEDFDEDEEPFTADTEGLRRFLKKGYGLGTSRGVRNWKTDRLSGRRRLVSHSIPTSYRVWLVMRCIWTASWSAPWPCCCGSRTCGGKRVDTDPFRKMSGSFLAVVLCGRARRGVSSASARIYGNPPESRFHCALGQLGLKWIEHRRGVA